MLRPEQIEIIEKYVPDKYFDKKRLIRYLSLHDKVGVEVFNYVAKEPYEDPLKGFETVLPTMFKLADKWELEMTPGKEDDFRDFVYFEPEDVDTFVRRIPFNFYHPGDDIRVDSVGKEMLVWRPVSIEYLFSALGSTPYSTLNYHRSTPLMLEDAYKKLEYLFYERKISIEEIFSYTDKVTGGDYDDIYGDWFDYIDKCMQLGWEDVMPEQFYYKYNLARELTGECPITFYIMEYDPEAWKRGKEQVQFCKRSGNKLEFYGKFPCDEKGQPVMRWIGIDIKNAESVELVKQDGLECHMVVTLTPKTVVHALVCERDEIGNEIPDVDPEWIQMYAGPQTMTFNYKLLKKRRNELGYTQQEVADAVEANIRTYQKWEGGETKPDGYYLLRILNWLDIPSINDVIIYDEP